ncbi:MAG: two-component system, OmpR family, sensor histidine kinase MprB [Nocardioidaceae bacterium]|jgi:two-component system sensor histidine kinase MprB|nr:two-component system, OmpR family, sensor histidine kinase MprB [Nocardioidaceae bacterium]MDX6309050.1 two-component system, OmpR family, sensor histidine kinase MprB [Nocardioidaceae bacterium]
MSLATRISLLAACAVGIAIAVASLAAYVTLRSQLHSRLDASLLHRAELASQSDLVASAAFNGISTKVLGAADVHIYLIYAGGQIRSPSNRAVIRPISQSEMLVVDGKLDHAFRTINQHGTDYRAVTVPVSSGIALMFTQSQSSIESTIDRVGLVLLLVGAGGIIAAALIGLAVARSALRPVRQLSEAAENIARTEQLTPIPVTGDDELASLASSFNGMLAALERSRDRQRRLVADAGHELRTPLTSLRTNLELLAQADKQGGMNETSRQEIFSDVTAQVEELSTLVGDLVELARDEPLSRTPEPLDMADIVARAVDRVRRRAPSVAFETQVPPWWVVGEAQILERAVTNLLDNAAKWSPAGGTVRIAMNRGELTVSDEGPGVAEADLPLIFERFYRASDARTMSGSGLGLSIVRQAAERHGGSVRAFNRQPHGAIFAMTLPGSPYRPMGERWSPEGAGAPSTPGLAGNGRPRAAVSPATSAAEGHIDPDGAPDAISYRWP